MTRVYLTDAKSEERSALRLLLLDLKMEVVGQAADWPTTLANVAAARPDMLLVEWELLPNHLGAQALVELREVCPNPVVIVLISQMDARQQAAVSSGSDAFISKNETPDRVASHLQVAAESVFTYGLRGIDAQIVYPVPDNLLKTRTIST